jgi:hypothetical protein
MRQINTIFIIIAILFGISLTLRLQHNEIVRLRSNNEALQSRVLLYRTKNNKSAASIAEMRLTISELRKQHRDALAEIESLGIRLRRVERYARSVTATTIRDTVVISTLTPSETLPSPRSIDYRDAWTTIRGEILGDSLAIEVTTRDTLHQVVHRIPRRFLGIPFGTKMLRQEVWSSNPHTEVVYTEYIRLKGRIRN